ncbi:O-methyltransferase [Desertivirga brevis]|uniref:O-methyltransferase n=1 Tax=Desertivirga brevis TaxID=2810310 RepID=UPI001A95C954|nr:methyltransferase domain-containing protein [Pedobacter sp. SYSU D00873]
MNDNSIILPENYLSIQRESTNINFSMPSDLQTGSLLRTLVTSKPKGRFLELGTGTGLSLSWIVEAMDQDSYVISIDNSEVYLAIAKKHFHQDLRVSIVCEDGNVWIKSNQDKKFDLIFADAWPGKYETLDETLNLLKTGGFYIIDDMLPQANWPEGHQSNVDRLISYLADRNDIRLTRMNWSTGLIIVAKI